MRQLADCRGTAVQPRSYRQWFISDYREPVLAAYGYTLTAAFKADMKLRPHIERIIAALVLHNGARHANFRGLPKTDFQVKPALSLPKGCAAWPTTRSAGST